MTSTPHAQPIGPGGPASGPDTMLGRRIPRASGDYRWVYLWGLPLRAMISVTLQSNARGKIRDFIQQIRRRRQVMDVYFLAGADDFILHVAARDTDDLRSFVVENLNADADVAGTQTSLIFEHLRGASPL